MRTKTRDTSEYGLHYLSGLIRMEAGRNMANIGRKTNVSLWVRSKLGRKARIW